MDIKIESGITKPDLSRSGGRSIYAQHIVRMQPGDSCHLGTLKEVRGMKNSARRLGYKLAYCAEAQCESEHTDGFRVWMVGPK